MLPDVDLLLTSLRAPISLSDQLATDCLDVDLLLTSLRAHISLSDQLATDCLAWLFFDQMEPSPAFCFIRCYIRVQTSVVVAPSCVYYSHANFFANHFPISCSVAVS
jgi:hypothetical protein